jgi:hypothetical protein
LAVIVWLPEVRLEVEYAAVPPLKDAFPIRLLPSRNATVPVAVAGTTVALNVTACPGIDGFTLEVSVIVA